MRLVNAGEWGTEHGRFGAPRSLFQKIFQGGHESRHGLMIRLILQTLKDASNSVSFIHSYESRRWSCMCEPEVASAKMLATQSSHVNEALAQRHTPSTPVRHRQTPTTSHSNCNASLGQALVERVTDLQILELKQQACSCKRFIKAARLDSLNSQIWESYRLVSEGSSRLRLYGLISWKILEYASVG